MNRGTGSDFNGLPVSVQLEFAQFHPLTGSLTAWPLVNVGVTAGERVNVRTKSSASAAAELGSVRLDLTGPQTVSRTDNTAPYTPFEEIAGSALAAGTYQISVTASSEADQGGTAGTTRTATFTLETDTSAPSMSVVSGVETPASTNLTSIKIDISEPSPRFGVDVFAQTNARSPASR